MPLEFKHIKDNADSTARYEVAFPKGLTVRDLVQTILQTKPNEWGYIDITVVDAKLAMPLKYQHHAKRIVKYSAGEIMSKDTALFDKNADKVIERIQAIGGYSFMSYIVYVSQPDAKPLSALEKIMIWRAKKYENR